MVPVDVIIDQIIAILQVLALRNTVGGDQNVDLLCAAWHQYSPSFGDGGEADQHIVQGSFQSFDSRFSINGPGNHGGIQPVFRFDIACHLDMHILRRIRERREDQHFSIPPVDRTVHLFVQQLQEILKFQIVF